MPVQRREPFDGQLCEDTPGLLAAAPLDQANGEENAHRHTRYGKDDREDGSSRTIAGVTRAARIIAGVTRAVGIDAYRRAAVCRNRAEIIARLAVRNIGVNRRA